MATEGFSSDTMTSQTTHSGPDLLRDEADRQAVVGTSAAPLEIKVAQASTTTPTASDAVVAVQVEVGADGTVRLPAGTVADNISFEGNNILLQQPDGSVIVIVNGVLNVPTIYLGDVQLPQETLLAAFEAAGIEPADNVLANGSGNNFEVPPGDIGDPFDLGDLLPFTELTFPTFELRELGPDLRKPTLLLSSGNVEEDDLRAGFNLSEGNNEDGSVGADIATGTLVSDFGSGGPAASGALVFNGGFPALLSQGVALNYVVTPAGQGQTLQAFADGRLVFTLELLVSGNSGGFRFTLNDQLDHPLNDFEDFLNLGFAITAKNGAGLTASGTFNVSVHDDIPVYTGCEAHVLVDEDDIDTDDPNYHHPGEYHIPDVDGFHFFTGQSDGNSPEYFNQEWWDKNYTEFGTGAAIVKGDLSPLFKIGSDEFPGEREEYPEDDYPEYRGELTNALRIKGGAGEGDCDDCHNDPYKDYGDNGAFSMVLGTAEQEALAAMGLSSKGSAGDPNLVEYVLSGPDSEGRYTLIGYVNESRIIEEPSEARAFISEGDYGTYARVVFTLTLEADGEFTFRLFDQLDHPNPGVGNMGYPVQDILDLDFSSLIRFSDYDGDTIGLPTGAFTVKVKDDVPELSHHKVVRIVDEDDIDTFHDGIPGGSKGTSPDDGNGDGSWTGSPAIGDKGPAFVFGSLQDTVVSGGADDDLTFALVNENYIRDQLSKLGLSSQGRELSYDVQDGELFGFVNKSGIGQSYDPEDGDRLVFKLTIKEDGSFEFRLYDQMDHDRPSSGADQNFDLQDGLYYGDVSAIDFGRFVKATDHDGDSVILKNKLIIKIRDDVPEQIAHKEITGVVEEEHLYGGNEDFTAQPDLDQDHSAPGDDFRFTTTVASGSGSSSLATLIKVGADENGKFTLDRHADGDRVKDSNGHYVKSNGEYVRFDYVDHGGHDHLEGRSEDGRLIFELRVEEDGDWKFELFDQVDHPINDIEDILKLDFSQFVKFTDFDGDTIKLSGGTFEIKIIDDVPVAKISATDYWFATHDETPGIDGGGADDVHSSNLPGSARAAFKALELSGATGDDPDVNAVSGLSGKQVIGYAYEDHAIVTTAGSSVGADSPAQQSVLSLTITNSNSGLFITEGYPISLVQGPNGLVLGKVVGGAFDGQVAFAIHMGQDGKVSIAQYLSIKHDDRGDPNEDDDNGTNSKDAQPDDSPNPIQQTLAGKLAATITITDADGDTASDSVQIGDRIRFFDDGPTLDVVGGSKVDEGKVLSGTWNLDAGADGVSSITIQVGKETKILSLDDSGNSQSIDTGVGTLTVKADGTWSFAAGSVASNQNVTFWVKAIDGDGDGASDRHQITIKNTTDPIVARAVYGLVEEEHGLPGGIDDDTGTPPQDADTGGNFNLTTNMDSHLFSLSGGDGTFSLSFEVADGAAAKWADGQNIFSEGGQVLLKTVGGVLIGYVDGGDQPDRDVFKVELTQPAPGQHGYKFTLLDNLDHHDQLVPVDNAETIRSVDLDNLVKVTSGDAEPVLIGDLQVAVIDDVPVAADNIATVDSGEVIPSDVVLIIDRSGSMGPAGNGNGGSDPDGAGPYNSRMEIVKDAIKELFDSGSVHAVFIASFASDATFHSSGVNGGWFTNLADALAAVNAINAATAGGTNYDAALNTVMSNYTAPPAGGGQLVSMFLSDGVPTEPIGGVGINATEESSWIHFLENNSFDNSFAFGFGGLNDTNKANMEPVAWSPGETVATHTDADPNVVVVTNITDLAAELTDAVTTPSVTGNVLTDDDGAGVDRFGADGFGGIVSIEHNGVTYHPADAVGDELTITTALDGKLVFNFATGEYKYFSPLDHTGVDVFKYAVKDGDGDGSTALLKIEVKDPDAIELYAAHAALAQVAAEDTGGVLVSDPDVQETLVGSNGDDTFVLNNIDLPDVIIGYSHDGPGGSDSVDLSELLDAALIDSANPIGNFVRVQADGEGHGVLQVDQDGSGSASSFQTVAVFDGMPDMVHILYGGNDDDITTPVA